MNVVYGDLLELALTGTFDVIVHGCNCQCVMGSGIAKTIKSAFPEAYEADRATEAGARSKLGTFSYARVEHTGGTVTVVNAYTQLHWRGGGCKVDYDAVRSAFSRIKTRFGGLRIGYPLIGAGLAGGDWERISEIIDTELTGEDHTLVRLPRRLNGSNN